MGIDSVPADVLLEIFKLYAIDHDKLSARASVKLTHVCRDWRNSACNGMPSLWAEIKIEQRDTLRNMTTVQKFVSTFLERSLPCPLTLDIDLIDIWGFPSSFRKGTIDLLVSVLMEHCNRWQKVTLRWNGELPFLSKSPIYVPCLNFLSLEIKAYSQNPIKIFQIAPLLTDLRMFGIYNKATLEIDWSLITGLECDNSTFLYTRCDPRVCPKLKKILLSDRFCTLGIGGSGTPGVFVNDTIEDMTLTYEGCESLLAGLRLSSLQCLYILECRLYELSPALLYNIQNPIQILHLSCPAIEEHMEKLHSILTAPCIQEISTLILEHRYTHDEQANFSLISGLFPGKDSILTNLKNLTFVFDSLKSAEETSEYPDHSGIKNGLTYYRHTEREALAVVDSRRNLAQHSDLPNNVQQLQSFTFRAIGFGRRVSKDFNEAMNKFEKNGLAVHIEMIDDEEEMWVWDEWVEGEERPIH